MYRSTTPRWEFGSPLLPPTRIGRGCGTAQGGGVQITNRNYRWVVLLCWLPIVLNVINGGEGGGFFRYCRPPGRLWTGKNEKMHILFYNLNSNSSKKFFFTFLPVQRKPGGLQHLNLEAKSKIFSSELLYNSKCPSVCPSVMKWGKLDFLGSYSRYKAETFCQHFN